MIKLLGTALMMVIIMFSTLLANENRFKGPTFELFEKYDAGKLLFLKADPNIRKMNIILNMIKEHSDEIVLITLVTKLEIELRNIEVYIYKQSEEAIDDIVQCKERIQISNDCTEIKRLIQEIRDFEDSIPQYKQLIEVIDKFKIEHSGCALEKAFEIKNYLNSIE